MSSAERGRVLILYGSQTGTAEGIAEKIAELAETDHGYNVDIVNMKDFKKVELEKEAALIVVTATHGDGEPTDNAVDFWRFLKRRCKTVGNLPFTVLGLGDTNYDNFCNMGILFDKQLEKLGGKRFYDLGKADDATGLEAVVEPWISGLWGPLSKVAKASTVSLQGCDARDEAVAEDCPSSCDKKTSSLEKTNSHLQLAEECPPENAIVDPITGSSTCCDNGLFSVDHPCRIHVVNARDLCACGVEKPVLHIELDVSGLDGKPVLTFHPGDAIGILCPNTNWEVEAVLSRLGLAGNEYFTAKSTSKRKGVPSFLPSPCEVRYCLTWLLDVRAFPKKGLLVSLAASCTDPKEAATLEALGGQDYAHLVARRPTLCELLSEFQSCALNLADLLAFVPRLQPRYYSVSATPQLVPNGTSIILSEVHYTTQAPWNNERDGLCSTYLRGLVSPYLRGEASAYALSERIPLAAFPHPTRDFRPPVDASTPMIMVGAGTGLAPFLAFLEFREAQKLRGATLGEAWLFFGCCTEKGHFIFREELEGFVKRGVLSHLVPAFSRDQAEKIYVQDRVKENGAAIVKNMLHHGATFYVCGDSMGMARGVEDALLDILQKHAEMTSLEATACVSSWREKKSYLRDLWG